MSKVLKASQAQVTQGAYFVHVQPIREAHQSVDPELDELKFEALQEAQGIREAARRDAEQIILAAEQQAQGLLEAERTRVEMILHNEIEAAKRVGYNEGYTVAQETVAQEYANAFAQVQTLYQLAEEDRRHYLDASEPMIVNLACSIADKIMRRESETDRSWVLEVVRAALEEIHDSGKVEVRVHPDDFEFVRDNRDVLRKVVPGQTDLVIIPDRAVAAGGCVLHTAFGNIDARIDTQLEEVRKALQDVAANLEA
ncbi:FliH/SctL family protein [Tumebacillus permanentifrigoris]|uniref:Flagellar assembly protein FliH n=1 Tax=Tumebacillus permanentifrigoris TaxID=378543 RepID=A0A316D7K7_9BACL|nr:FliH/SctL family protein [Tumebacillus permanentifrigoris]PWK12713.1 flagellar assembly protein FliH [Tumebacillus permanentifrigoris]